MLWRANVEPPVFKVGDEVCFWQASAKDTNIVAGVRMTFMEDEEGTQEIMVKGNPFFYPARNFVRVRRST